MPYSKREREEIAKKDARDLMRKTRRVRPPDVTGLGKYDFQIATEEASRLGKLNRRLRNIKGK